MSSAIPAIVAIMIIGTVLLIGVPVVLIYNSQSLHGIDTTNMSTETQEAYEYYTDTYDLGTSLYMQLTSPIGLLLMAVAALILVIGFFALMRSVSG